MMSCSTLWEYSAGTRTVAGEENPNTRGRGFEWGLRYARIFLLCIFGIPVVGCFLLAVGTVEYMNCYIQYLFILSFPSFPLPCIQQQQQQQEEEEEEEEGPSFYLLLPSASSPLPWFPSVRISSDPPLQSHVIPVAFGSSVPNFSHSLTPSPSSETVHQQRSNHSYSTVSPRAPTWSDPVFWNRTSSSYPPIPFSLRLSFPQLLCSSARVLVQRLLYNKYRIAHPMHYIYPSFCQSYPSPCQYDWGVGVRTDWGGGGRWEIVPHVEPFLQQQKIIGNVIIVRKSPVSWVQLGVQVVGIKYSNS